MSTAEATATLEPVESTRFTPSAQGWIARLVVHVLIFGGALLITAMVPGYWAFRISLAAIYAIIGLSLNVVLGYVGQVSLGHHGFVGIAAFISAWYVTTKAGCSLEQGCSLSSFFVATALAVLSGGVAAGLLGLVALRIRGLYLALITLSYGFMAETAIFQIPALTRGGAGMPAPAPDGFTSDNRYAFLTLAFLALVIYIDWRLIRSKVGRAILSIKHSEPVAASYGINVTAYKTMAFVLSGMFAGLAGALLAFRVENVVSNDFDFSLALLWVLMVVVGGLGNRVGVVVGSAFFALFPFILSSFGTLKNFFDKHAIEPELVGLALGAALALFTIISYQGGIGEQLSPLTRWLGGKPFTRHPEEHAAPKGHQRKKLLSRMGLDKSGETPTEESAAVETPSEPVEEDA
ncbi:MAG TPA: branched-chain amino acid ABC transporter permease [Actinomycetota bacterium]|nr:branched-chain amino acid ABC transporter permease [Actinomycetota bacterium]